MTDLPSWPIDPAAGGGAASSIATAAPTSLVPGQLLFQYTPSELIRLFAGTLASEWNLGGVGDVQPTIVEEHAKSGKAAKFKLTAAQERSELALAGDIQGEDGWAISRRVYEGRRYRYSFYAYVPVGGMVYGGPGKHNTIWQLHGGTGASGATFSLELGKYPTGGEKQGLYLARALTTNEGEKTEGLENLYLHPFPEGELHHVEIEFTASERLAGSYVITVNGQVVIEVEDGVNTVDPSENEYGYIKTGLYRGAEGTSELFVSQVEWEELSDGTVTVWFGQEGGDPIAVGTFEAPAARGGDVTETWGSISVANGATVAVKHKLEVNGEKVVPRAVIVTPQNEENALEPKIYVRVVNETEFSVRNSGAKTMKVYWLAKA